MNKNNNWFFIFFSFVFTVILGGFFINQLNSNFKQHKAESYPTTQGKIQSAEVDEFHTTRGGEYYRPEFNYCYTVDGVSHYGLTYRYDGLHFSEAAAQKVVSAHPPGSIITVFYNPENAEDSLLSPGISRHSVMSLFMQGGLGALFFLFFAASFPQVFFKPPPFAETGGIPLITEGSLIRLRLANLWAIILRTGMTVFGLSLLAALLMIPEWHPQPLVQALVTLIALLTVSCLTFTIQCQWMVSGANDLLIDEFQRTIRMPMTIWKRKQPTRPISDLKRVIFVRKPTRYDPNWYAVILEFQDGSSQELTQLNENRAVILGGFLAKKLNLQIPDIPAKSD
jgi:hypothetical protein